MERPDSVMAAAGIVLTGGRSSRMGRPKALLCFDNEPLIDHIVTKLHVLFDEVVVVQGAYRSQAGPMLFATASMALSVFIGSFAGYSIKCGDYC